MDDGTNANSFVHVGKPSAVVINLAARAKAWRELRASAAKIDPDWANLMEVERGKSMITKGIEFIQKNASPEEAIQYLKDTLAAISGSSE